MTALTIEHLEKIYKNGYKALSGVDLKVESGDFFALLGPNGAGKTTLIGIISSLVTKTAGKVHVFDADMDKNLELAKSYIGLVPQEFNFSLFEKVQDIVANQAGFYGLSTKLARQRTEKYLRQLQLWDKRHAQARMLSGGMKRRLMIARALVHEPRLLILDEPTAGVDIEIRHSMWEFLRDINRQGITIILTTHYLEEAENLCRHIAIIERGRMIENTSMSDLLNRMQGDTLVLHTQQPMTQLPELPSYLCRLLDACSLEIELKPGQNLNELFDRLSQCQIQITRIKNKRNRLEEFFIRMMADQREES